MSDRFDYFIMFAEMRTGSNFLEANLNAIDGVTCHGEAFNPHFIGYPNKVSLLGITQDEREANPARLIAAIRDEPGVLGGFRFFHDHDPRVLDIALEDPRCAKIILTRNPLDSYVSWKIAQATGQWKLTDVKRRKEARAVFDPAEFAAHVEALQDFQVTLLNRLQRSGQTAFYIAYEDLRDIEVINGLAQWLGVRGRLQTLDDKLKPQNPGPVTAKVENPDQMIAALGGLDRFNLTRTPNFEPRRGPAVPGFVACETTPLMFMPVRGGPEREIRDWLAALDGVAPGKLLSGMTQKQARQWMRNHPGHRRFTVLRHPLARAHEVFCSRILSTGPGSYRKIRETLRRRYKLPIPAKEPGQGYTPADHRAAFESFLDFVAKNLAGQTSVRVDPEWATQAGVLTGFAQFAVPDLVLREDEITEQLPALARRLGRDGVLPPASAEPAGPYALSDIYDDALEARAADVYQRDYLLFGFGPWNGK